jgi:predicted RNase H-like nuclease (RuvC/YqgF family)
MTAFNSFHIKAFNQKCKHLIGEGKTVLTHKEIRDLNSEIMDLLLCLNSQEVEIQELKKQVSQNEIVIELDGKSFK